MPSVREVLGTMTEALTPGGAILRLRFRVSLDMLLTAAITLMAVGLAVTYQVLLRLGPRRAGTP